MESQTHPSQVGPCELQLPTRSLSHKHPRLARVSLRSCLIVLSRPSVAFHGASAFLWDISKHLFMHSHSERTFRERQDVELPGRSNLFVRHCHRGGSVRGRFCLHPQCVCFSSGTLSICPPWICKCCISSQLWPSSSISICDLHFSFNMNHQMSYHYICSYSDASVSGHPFTTQSFLARRCTRHEHGIDAGNDAQSSATGAGVHPRNLNVKYVRGESSERIPMVWRGVRGVPLLVGLGFTEPCSF